MSVEPRSSPFEGSPNLSARAFAAGVFEIAEDRHGNPSRLCVSRAARQFLLCGFRPPPLRLTRSLAPGTAKNLDAIAIHRIGADRLEGRVGFHSVAAGRGDLAFYDLAEAVDLRMDWATTDAPELMLWFPRALLPKPLAEFEGLHGLILRGESPAGALVGAALTGLEKEAPRATDREFDAMAKGVLALIAAAVLPSLEAAGRGPPPLASFVTIRRYIDKNLQAPGLNADSLAKTFGLSRASLYRLFEPVGGVAAYIRAARLQRAYREIVDAEFADRRIGPVAYGLGFKNVSAFNRLFRQEFGASPRELRAGRPPGASDANAAPGKEGEFTLLEWLRNVGAAPAIA